MLQDKLYVPTMVSRLKQIEGNCVHCSHYTLSFDGCPLPSEIVSVDPSQGRHQSLQDIFSASMKQTARCCEQDCMALDGQAVQEQFVQWPLALMLFFQQRPVCPAAQQGLLTHCTPVLPTSVWPVNTSNHPPLQPLLVWQVST